MKKKKKSVRKILLISVISIVVIAVALTLIIKNQVPYTGNAISNQNLNQYSFNYAFSENLTNNSNYKIMFNKAFNEIEYITDNQLTFKEVNYSDKNADIKINLIKQGMNMTAGDAFVLGKSYYPYHQNLTAEINLYLYNEGETGGYPLVEMHELLHTLGINHVNNTLMTGDGVLYKQLSFDKTLTRMLKEEWNLSYIRYKTSLGIWNIQ